MAERANTFAVPPPTPARRYSDQQVTDVADYFFYEVEEALASRFQIEANWRDCLRMYDGVPEHQARNTPIPNAPNIEVPVGAIAADAIYAEAVDLVYQISPTITARAVDERWVKHGKALQRLANHGAENEWGLRRAVMHAFADDTQLGTGVYYIPWLEQIRKTLTGRAIVASGPRIRALAPENFIVPGSAPAWLEDARWLCMRSFRTPSELSVLAKMQGWDIEGVKALASSMSVRQTRERLGRTSRTGVETRHLAEILEGYIAFDIDDDGIPEDLYIAMDRVSRRVCKLRPDPYDRRRPFESMVYQPRPHLFNGLGVVEMLREFERSATEIHNQRVLNMLLANARVYVRKEGTGSETEEMWPGKVILVANPADDFKAFAMADVYTSAIQAETILMQYAERRTGVGDLGQGRSSALGSRTPGITALSAIQNVSKRFTPAFDEMRIATARAVQQCLFRYQERVLADDQLVMQRLVRMLGPEDGALVIELLRNPDFDDGVLVELTASSASVNRDADKQNAMLLAQFMGQYYKQLIELMTLISNPMLPPELKATGLMIVDKAGELVDRTIRAFDQVRDPAAFVLTMEEINRASADVQQEQQVAQLMQMLAQGAGVNGAGNGMGPPPQGLPPPNAQGAGINGPEGLQ